MSQVRASLLLLLSGVLLCSGNAFADRGALSLDAGGGMAALTFKAPFAESGSATRSFSPTARFGARYALANWLELGAAGFFETPVTVFHNDISLAFDDNSFPGTLRHRVHRYGGMGGARVTLGMVWRLTLGLDLGWSHRVYEELQHFEVKPGGASDYRLAFPGSLTRDDLVVAPIVGLEWSIGDHWSVSVLPRAEFLLGSDTAFSVSIPLVFSYSWYL